MSYGPFDEVTKTDDGTAIQFSTTNTVSGVLEVTGLYYGPVVAKVVDDDVLLICYIYSTYEQLETLDVDAYKRVDGKLKLFRARTGLTNYSQDNFLKDVSIVDGTVYGIGNLSALTYAVAPIRLAEVFSDDDATNE